MKNYLISYDLNAPNQNYSALIDKIKSAPHYIKINQSTWFVKSPYSSIQIAQILEQTVDSNDVIFVAEITNCGWSKSLDINIQAYLSKVWQL